MKARKIVLRLMIAALLVSFFLLPYSGAQTPKPEPMSMEDVIGLLKGKVSPDRVDELVRENGINFAVTPETEAALRSAGANDGLLRTLRELAPKPVPVASAPTLPQPQLSTTPLLTLRGHSKFLYSVAWSPDGKWLATGSGDNTAKVWDAATGRELRTLSGHKEGVTSVAWSPDGKRVATGSWDKTAKVWDAASGKELLTLGGHTEAVNSVAWSPDGKRLATASDDHTAKIW